MLYFVKILDLHFLGVALIYRPEKMTKNIILMKVYYNYHILASFTLIIRQLTRKFLPLLAILFLTYSEFGQAGKSPELSCWDRKKISDKIISYINQLDRQVIEFEHIEQDTRHQGAILLNRDKGLIINYYPPYPFYIQIAKKTGTLFVYDFEMKESFFENAANSYLDFFFRPETILSDINKISQDSNYYFFEYNDESSGSVINFAFNKSPLKLSYINIIHEQGKSQIAINDIKTANFGSSGIFKIHNPKIFGAPKQYKREDILKFLR
jgi:hypothetical protein